MQLVIGGLHLDDFEYAVQMGNWLGKEFIGFQRAGDGYHWQAVYDDNFYEEFLRREETKNLVSAETEEKCRVAV